MSRPRFLANHDLTEAIPSGVIRREPAIEFARLREVGMARSADRDVLDYAARMGLLIVSHDVNTMTAHAAQRIVAGLSMPGIFVARQGDRIGMVIEDLLLIWSASEAEEWAGQVTFLAL